MVITLIMFALRAAGMPGGVAYSESRRSLLGRRRRTVTRVAGQRAVVVAVHR